MQVRADMQQATVHSALLAALGAETGLFAFAQQSLGEPLALSTVYAVAQGVTGVEHVLATAFHPEGQTAAVLDRIAVPADAIATGGHASDATVGRLSLQLVGGVT